MTLIDVIVIGLAGWRLASMLVFESGPLDVFDRFRHLIGIPDEGEITGILPKVFSCVYCLGVYTTLAMAGIWWAWELPVMLAAATAIVVIIEKYVRWSYY